MKKLAFFLYLFLMTLSLKAQENVSINFSNDYNDVYHLSLIIYTPDGKIQTRVSNLNPSEIKTYSLPANTEIFIADGNQEAFAMKGNDIKSTGLRPYIVLSASASEVNIKLSSLANSQMSAK